MGVTLVPDFDVLPRVGVLLGEVGVRDAGVDGVAVVRPTAVADDLAVGDYRVARVDDGLLLVERYRDDSVAWTASDSGAGVEGFVRTPRVATRAWRYDCPGGAPA